MADHVAQPRIKGPHMVCARCGDRVYQRMTRRVTPAREGVRERSVTWRRMWFHLGYRNTRGLRRSLMERSGGSYEGFNFGTGMPER